MPLASGRLAAGPEGVVASLRLDDRHSEVSFRASNGELRPWPDALIPLLLLPAMRTGSAAGIDGEVSRRLVAAIPMIQIMLNGWYPDELARVEVETMAAAGEPAVGTGRTACLFTAGVDSFAEVVSRSKEIDELVFIRGIDLQPGSEGEAESYAAVRLAAVELGLPLTEVDTDLRTFLDPVVAWNRCNGAARAAVTLLFQHRFSRVLLTNSNNGHDLTGWGSHPLLDPLWSTERLEFEVAGRGSMRGEKVAAVAGSDTAMRRLRVCWKPTAGKVNCGRCEKCLRTAVSLLALGALERCATLPDAVEPEWLASVEVDEILRPFWEENLAALRAGGRAPALAAEIERLLARQAARGPATEQLDHADGMRPELWAELERQAGLDLESVAVRGAIRVRLRRLALRLMRPHTSHARLVDRHLVVALRQLRAQLEAERVARDFLRRRIERLESERRPRVTDSEAARPSRRGVPRA